MPTENRNRGGTFAQSNVITETTGRLTITADTEILPANSTRIYTSIFIVSGAAIISFQKVDDNYADILILEAGELYELPADIYYSGPVRARPLESSATLYASEL